jgi:predicted amidophosphoribosyltransferase
VYSPGGSSVASRRSRTLRALLKAGGTGFQSWYAVHVGQQMDVPLLKDFLARNPVVVPVPGNRSGSGGSFVAKRLAHALVQAGLGERVFSGLRRVRPVVKSATAPPGGRPTVAAHFDSFAIDSNVPIPHEILLVDDVVTRGRTLLAAAARFKEASPTSNVQAFALLRTLRHGLEIDRLFDPCVGEIRLRAGDARRKP